MKRKRDIPMPPKLKFAACVILVVCIATSATALVRHRVNQTGLQFSVASLRVQRGDMIIFSNGDRSSHNITVRGATTFNGGLQRPGETLEVPFTAAGQYQVICGIHPRMRLDVDVR
jgi:cytochrome c peroxidase